MNSLGHVIQNLACGPVVDQSDTSVQKQQDRNIFLGGKEIFCKDFGNDWLLAIDYTQMIPE